MTAATRSCQTEPGRRTGALREENLVADADVAGLDDARVDAELKVPLPGDAPVLLDDLQRREIAQARRGVERGDHASGDWVLDLEQRLADPHAPSAPGVLLVRSRYTLHLDRHAEPFGIDVVTATLASELGHGLERDQRDGPDVKRIACAIGTNEADLAAGVVRQRLGEIAIDLVRHYGPAVEVDDQFSPVGNGVA